MARFAFWQNTFWHRLGRWFTRFAYVFGSREAADGVAAEIVPQIFTPSKVWVTVKNRPGLGPDDWDKVSLAKGAPAPGGFLLVTDVKKGPKKVSWFLHS